MSDNADIQGGKEDTIMAIYYDILNQENNHSHLRAPFTDICNLTNDPKLPSIHYLDDDSLYIIFSYFETDKVYF